MSRLNMYFKRKEFACRCGCGFDTVDATLLEVLTDLRDFIGEPIVINSGCRCAKHNSDEGGAKNSQHLYGKAADIRFQSSSKTPLEAIHSYLISKYPDLFGIAIEGRFVHIDVRSGKAARWSY